MSRKERERKMQRLEQTEAEKALILERRKERLAPAYRMMRKFLLALVVTILILYVGIIIVRDITPGGYSWMKAVADVKQTAQSEQEDTLGVNLGRFINGRLNPIS